MIAAMLIGAAAGMGLLCLAIAVAPPRIDLAAAVGKFDANRAATPIPIAESPSWIQLLAGRIATSPVGRALVLPGLRENLTLVGRTVEQHFISKSAVAIVGLVIPFGVVAVLTSAGISTGATIPAITGLAMAAGFSLLPDLSLARAAEDRRTELRRALACYLDLV